MDSAASLHAEELNALGLEANKRGDARGALALFVEAHALLPTDARFLLSAANMHLKLGEASAACALYAKLQNLGMTPRQQEIARKKHGQACTQKELARRMSLAAEAAPSSPLPSRAGSSSRPYVSTSRAEDSAEAVPGCSQSDALYSAAYYGNAASMQKLLSRGADVNWRHPQGGSSALYVACEFGHATVARLLLSKGASPDQARDDGATALYKVCNDGNIEVAALLLNAGAEVDQMNPQGMTPLWAACHRGEPVLIRALLDAKADPLRKVLGWSSLDLAKFLKLGEAAKTIMEYVPEDVLAESQPRWLREAQALLGPPAPLRTQQRSVQSTVSTEEDAALVTSECVAMQWDVTQQQHHWDLARHLLDELLEGHVDAAVAMGLPSEDLLRLDGTREAEERMDDAVDGRRVDRSSLVDRMKAQEAAALPEDATQTDATQVTALARDASPASDGGGQHVTDAAPQLQHHGAQTQRLLELHLCMLAVQELQQQSLRCSSIDIGWSQQAEDLPETSDDPRPGTEALQVLSLQLQQHLEHARDLLDELLEGHVDAAMAIGIPSPQWSSTGYAIGSYEALKRHGEGGDGSTCAGARSQDVAQQLPGLKDSEPAEVTPQQPTDPAHAIQFHGAQTQRLLELHSLVLAGAEQHQQWLHGGEAPYVEFSSG